MLKQNTYSKIVIAYKHLKFPCDWFQVFRNNSLPRRKKHKSKQQEIINLRYFVLQQFKIAFSFFIKRRFKILERFVAYTRGHFCFFCHFYYHFFVIFSSTELTPFLMHNRYAHIFILTFDLVSFFPLSLNGSLRRHKSFVLRKEKMHKTKTTEDSVS